MCQQGWSMLRLSSLPLWQNQRTLLAHCPPQSLHRRQLLSPSKRMVPKATERGKKTILLTFLTWIVISNFISTSVMAKIIARQSDFTKTFVPEPVQERWHRWKFLGADHLRRLDQPGRWQRLAGRRTSMHGPEETLWTDTKWSPWASITSRIRKKGAKSFRQTKTELLNHKYNPNIHNTWTAVHHSLCSFFSQQKRKHKMN